MPFAYGDPVPLADGRYVVILRVDVIVSTTRLTVMVVVKVAIAEVVVAGSAASCTRSSCAWALLRSEAEAASTAAERLRRRIDCWAVLECGDGFWSKGMLGDVRVSDGLD